MDIIKQQSGENWNLYNGDCVEVVSGLPDSSIDYSIFSPPFASLYTYSNSPRDMGNCRTDAEFFEHFSFLVAELARVMKPGRNVSFHCMQLPTSKERDGYIGLKDFRGELIRCFQQHGFIYASEVVIWKDPVTAMQRTKALGLLHKTVRTNASMCRQGIPDYLITMRSPGEVTDKVTHDPAQYPVDKWQKAASPVWMDINPSNTLSLKGSRDDDDEKHICPLQLDVIERGIQMWSNPGDVVLTPFLGIGSEVYQAVKMGRKGVGIELKSSYFRVAKKNCELALKERAQKTLF